MLFADPTQIESIFTAYLLLGLCHVTVSFIPAFFDQTVRSKLGFSFTIVCILILGFSFLLFQNDKKMFIYVVQLTTFLHSGMQYYGFLRVTQKKSTDAPWLKKAEIFFLAGFLIVSMIYWHFYDLNNLRAMDYNYNRITAPLIKSDVPFNVNLLLVAYFISLMGFIYVKLKNKTDNLSSLLLLTSAHLFFFVGRVYYLTPLIIILGIKISHDLPYMYAVYQQWKKSEGYSGFFADKNKIYFIVAATLLPATLIYYFALNVAHNGTPNIFYYLSWTPSLLHYAVDSRIWTKDFNLRFA